MMLSSDSKYLEREKLSTKEIYLKEIFLKIIDSGVLVIFGPADTYLKFNKEVK